MVFILTSIFDFDMCHRVSNNAAQDLVLAKDSFIQKINDDRKVLD